MTAEAIVQARVMPKFIEDIFNGLGGDCAKAVSRAKDFSSISKWLAWQAAQAAAAGAVAVATPVLHAPLTAVDVIFLLHKMAYCCWGVGSILGCPVDAKEDLGIILAMYAGAVTEDMIVASAGTGALLVAGNAVVTMGLPAFISKVSAVGAGHAVGGLSAKLVGKGAGKALAKGAGKALAVSVPLISHISGKLAEKFAAKLGMKFVIKGTLKPGSNLLAGFIPFAGAAISAGINTYFVVKIANTAERYYRIKSSALAV